MAKLYGYFAVFIAFCNAINSEPIRPNYITEEEFACARAEGGIKIQNQSTLYLPPDDSAAVNSPQPRPGFGKNLWTNAQVPYTLDPTFDDSQRRTVAQALEEYHKNTCIRFIPKTDAHRSWVDILHDPNVCGVAHLCMNHGAQFAKFGGSCVNTGVMVHELGHTLCMGHEQTRRDRDKWIEFDRTKCEPHGLDGEDFSGGLHKLYDYVSIEHYEGECYNGCIVPKKPGVTKCGSGGPLSVLDIEILNEMYGCGGCHSHRFINHQRTLNRPVVVGKNLNGNELTICRVYHQGDIIPGKYDQDWKQCHVAWGGREHMHTEDVEVLCNPSWANLHWVRGPNLPSNAVRGGRSRERETLYIIRCPYQEGGRAGILPGKFHPGYGAYTSYGGREIRCQEFEFLVCS